MVELRTVVLPVAGNGTRMYPATWSVPKELLPVYDTPLIQLALDEAVAAGAERIVVVTGPGKDAIRQYFSDVSSDVDHLERSGKSDVAQELARCGVPDSVEVVFRLQDEPRGLGHAVLQAADALLPGPFGVILPDDAILDGSCLPDMARAFDNQSMEALVAAEEVSAEDVSSYGIFRTRGASIGRVIATDGLVEKPARHEAPSRLAAVGRYVLTPQIMEALSQTPPGAGNEIQLTDAIAKCGKVFAFPIGTPRFDCGSKEGLFQAGEALRDARHAPPAVGLAAE